MTVQRNLDTEQARRFWACVDEGAKQYMALPKEQRGVLGTRGTTPTNSRCANPERPVAVGLTSATGPKAAR